MKNKKFTNYIFFWLTQSVSQLGSSMTSFALIIWAYKQTGSPLTVSLMAFCLYLPSVLVSVFAGAFIDKHKKKGIMLISDFIAVACSLFVLLLILVNQIEIWHIYIVNIIMGSMNSFQSPATSVALGIVIQKQQYARASGMSSFTTSLLTIVTPMLAGSIYALWGLKGVILIDLISFIFAFNILLFFIKIPEQIDKDATKNRNIFSGCKEGLRFLSENKGIWYVMISFAIINFFSRITYENILPAMILARSGSSESTFGIVSGILGFGGIAGGLIMSIKKEVKDIRKLIYFSAALSFLFGDLLLGLGQNIYVWSIGALMASVPIPFIVAGYNLVLYKKIPKQIQGRVFAVRNSIQYFTISLGILIGGTLAEFIFETFMMSQNVVAIFLQKLVGSGTGSGMAVMFLCTGILGCVISVIFYFNKEIRELNKSI